jgi:CBS-domain-containing membrane protein
MENETMLEGTNLTARDVMTRDVITVFPHTSVRYVAKLLAEHHIGGVPVVDDERHLVGIVSENDLLEWADEPSEKQAWWLNMLAEGFELEPAFLDVVRSERDKVRTVMKTDVSTVSETTPVAEIAKILVSRSIKRVPVVHGKAVVGIVTRADLVRALANR